MRRSVRYPCSAAIVSRLRSEMKLWWLLWVVQVSISMITFSVSKTASRSLPKRRTLVWGVGRPCVWQKVTKSSSLAERVGFWVGSMSPLTRVTRPGGAQARWL